MFTSASKKQKLKKEREIIYTFYILYNIKKYRPIKKSIFYY